MSSTMCCASLSTSAETALGFNWLNVTVSGSGSGGNGNGNGGQVEVTFVAGVAMQGVPVPGPCAASFGQTSVFTCAGLRVSFPIALASAALGNKVNPSSITLDGTTCTVQPNCQAAVAHSDTSTTATLIPASTTDTVITHVGGQAPAPTNNPNNPNANNDSPNSAPANPISTPVIAFIAVLAVALIAALAFVAMRVRRSKQHQPPNTESYPSTTRGSETGPNSQFMVATKSPISSNGPSSPSSDRFPSPHLQSQKYPFIVPFPSKSRQGSNAATTSPAIAHSPPAFAYPPSSASFIPSNADLGSGIKVLPGTPGSLVRWGDHGNNDNSELTSTPHLPWNPQQSDSNVLSHSQRVAVSSPIPQSNVINNSMNPHDSEYLRDDDVIDLGYLSLDRARKSLERRTTVANNSNSISEDVLESTSPLQHQSFIPSALSHQRSSIPLAPGGQLDLSRMERRLLPTSSIESSNSPLNSRSLDRNPVKKRLIVQQQQPSPQQQLQSLPPSSAAAILSSKESFMDDTPRSFRSLDRKTSKQVEIEQQPQPPRTLSTNSNNSPALSSSMRNIPSKPLIDLGPNDIPQSLSNSPSRTGSLQRKGTTSATPASSSSSSFTRQHLIFSPEDFAFPPNTTHLSTSPPSAPQTHNAPKKKSSKIVSKSQSLLHSLSPIIPLSTATTTSSPNTSKPVNIINNYNSYSADLNHDDRGLSDFSASSNFSTSSPHTNTRAGGVGGTAQVMHLHHHYHHHLSYPPPPSQLPLDDRMNMPMVLEHGNTNNAATIPSLGRRKTTATATAEVEQRTVPQTSNEAIEFALMQLRMKTAVEKQKKRKEAGLIDLDGGSEEEDSQSEETEGDAESDE
ncbi:UNVERIFIED_CONTAM: hypothetical protein HDU68_012318 [Siphonaria sp. JEL0065]|nr:hypothetical protein HDU68_012318 [Siphonaria sp. JEL0065]